MDVIMPLPHMDDDYSQVLIKSTLFMPVVLYISQTLTLHVILHFTHCSNQSGACECLCVSSGQTKRRVARGSTLSKERHSRFFSCFWTFHELFQKKTKKRFPKQRWLQNNNFVVLQKIFTQKARIQKIVFFFQKRETKNPTKTKTSRKYQTNTKIVKVK